MRSPEDMRIVEIDITNACIHNCSNCTRMCGHHKKPYFMSWETFKRAVDSMEGYRGGVSMMGGEPTLHPEFERFARYLESKYTYLEPKKNYFIKPTRNFVRDRWLEERNYRFTYTEKTNGNILGNRAEGPTLFSSLASNYYKYYETIQDVFRFQGINDHVIPCVHQPVGVMRSDLNIPDEEWIKLRNKCWVQNTWSASITPKGAFFCEIAGVLDMLFDGPGGWPIEKGWWRRKPDDFKEQLHWCELCGLALDTPSRDANEETDDVSETFYKKLEEIGSPKLKKGHVVVYNPQKDVEDDKIKRAQYHKSNLDRLSRQNNSIYPKGFCGVIIANDERVDELIKCIEVNKKHFLSTTVVLGKELHEVIKKDKSIDETIELLPREERLGVSLAKINQNKLMDYIICMTQDVLLKDSFLETMMQYVFNPGTMHYASYESVNKEDQELFSIKDGWLCLYNTNALALREAGFDTVAQCKTDKEFVSKWSKDKTIRFGKEIFEDRKLTNEIEVKPHKKYVIFGTAMYGKRAFEMVGDVDGEVVFACDNDTQKQGKTIWGDVSVYSPDYLSKRRKEYDYVIIASMSYQDIRGSILEQGLNDDEIIAPVF